MNVTAQQANEARENLISFARNNQLIDAAIAAIKEGENAEEAIRTAASQDPFGSWDVYFGLTDEWLSADLHDDNGDVVDDPMDATDTDEVWDRVSEKHISDLISVAERIINE
mgnify:CR=1 FL=1